MSQASFPEVYERALVGPLFQPFAVALLERAGLSGARSVLDVACGTGIVARLAKERLGAGVRVVGVDLSAPMLDVARRIAPDIDWRQGDAAALPVAGDERFDAVLCQQGLQFFPDRPAAIAEMRRVLAPGGRLAVATWWPLDVTPFFRDLHAIAVRHLGPFLDRRHSLGDPRALQALVSDAGFAEVQVEGLTRRISFADAGQFVRLNTMALVGMSDASKTMDETRKAAIVDAIVQDSVPALAPYAEGPGLAFDLGANIATARQAGSR
jgi:ubiquinone/menaquinone biosynthesis C-methylase UbiE